MSKNPFLENWDEYESRKKQKGQDPGYFSCDEAWEVWYLKKKVLSEYPNLNQMLVLEAIGECCRNITVPVLRSKFIERLLLLLNITDSGQQSGC